MIQATPALPATLPMMPEQMVGVQADLEIAPAITVFVPPKFSNDASTPLTNPLTTNPARNPLTNSATNPMTHSAPNPLTNQEILSTTSPMKQGTLANGLVASETGTIGHGAILPVRHLVSPTAKELPHLIPRASFWKQDRWTALTNKDGLVILSKSTFLTKLWSEWRYLLDLTQMLNLCFSFEHPILHQDYHQANTNSHLACLGPFSPTHWKDMAEVHCLFPRDVGYMYIA
jgi:hypothetical protein